MPRRSLTSADSLRPFGPRRQPVVCNLLVAWGWLDTEGKRIAPDKVVHSKKAEQLPLLLIIAPNQYRNV